jgi:CRP/FNR family transcriptional regulator
MTAGVPEGERDDPSTPGWVSSFPQLAALDDPALSATCRAGQELLLPAGTDVFRDGDPCRNYLLVRDGSVRVYKSSPGGREIVLYRVGPGQGCVFTTSVLLAGGSYPARGTTECETHAIAIPAALFQSGMDQSPGFRRFVCAEYASRTRQMVLLLEALAFSRIDMRVADWLLTNQDEDCHVRLTHRALALELGTAREVISRHLKEFDRAGLVELARGRIRVLDPERLVAYASSGHL